ncbi:MAG: hypothetical protein GY854_28295 [Deltaproteobacteria bacterium]|nr:hypothetical protein [Deltaproteobacteria bacterium]
MPPRVLKKSRLIGRPTALIFVVFVLVFISTYVVCIRRPELPYTAFNKPYVLEMSCSKGEILYFGTVHTNDPSHAMIANIQKSWRSFGPTVAFSEGGVRPSVRSLDQAVDRFGEPGALRFLADRDNVPIRSLDPPLSEQVSWLVNEFSTEKIKLYFILRQVSQYHRLSQQSSLEEYIRGYLDHLSRHPPLAGSPSNLKEIDEVTKRLMPNLGEWRRASGNWTSPSVSGSFTNVIAKKMKLARDRHMVSMLVDEVRKGQRVFAVVGMSHVIWQEEALEAELTAHCSE